MISSVALPNVAFSSPPTVGPRYLESSSVACPIYPASGRIASAAVRNTHPGAALTWERITLIGTNSSSPSPMRATGDTSPPPQQPRGKQERHRHGEQDSDVLVVGEDLRPAEGPSARQAGVGEDPRHHPSHVARVLSIGV